MIAESERAARLDDRHRVRNRRAKVSGSQRPAIAVEDDGLRVDALTVREHHSGGPTVGHDDFGDVRAVAQLRAVSFGHARKRARNFVHAALHAPDSLLLDVGDEHQRRRRAEGRRTAVRRVATEQLLQARVTEKSTDGRPHPLPRPHPQQLVDAPEPDASREFER